MIYRLFATKCLIKFKRAGHRFRELLQEPLHHRWMRRVDLELVRSVVSRGSLIPQQQQKEVEKRNVDLE